MMQGGINNAALFGASQRSARGKLDQMAGISRPSGILASSPELMQAAMPPAPPPVMQQSPASMVGAPMAPPPVAPPMPSMPMPTTVAPRPLNPMAGNPTAGQPVVQLNEGGFLDRVKESAVRGVEAINTGLYGNADAVDITMDTSEFDRVLKTLNPESTKYLLETYGDEAGIAQAAQRKLNNVSAAVESKDPAQISDQVLVEAGEQPTDAAKMDFAENVFGMEDVNDIDEINRRIANVAVGSAVGKSPDEFSAAVLMGLQAYKQTASARAAAAASASSAVGGEKSRQEYLYKSVFDATYKAALEVDPENPTAALAAAKQAAVTAAPNAPSATMGGQPAAAPAQTPLQQVQDALRLEPKRREEILKQATDMGIDVKGL